VTAWAVILVIALFRIVLQEVFQYPVSQDLRWGAPALVALFGLVLTYAWKAVRSLRPMMGLFLVLAGAEWLVWTRVDRLPFFQRLLHNPSFSVSMPVEKAMGVVVTLIVILYLSLVQKRREAFFLAKGDLAAPAEPVKWLGIKAGETWRTLGRSFAVYLSLGTLAFLIIAGRPPLDIVVRALPFLPAVLLAAALNAFNEEMSYKASFLAVLEGIVGKQQSLLLMAAYFGIMHYYGVPYGIIGVLLAAFLGWVLGKSMLETRGLAWAWFLHFLQDVWIFAFMAIGSITPGGQ
jgi:hypothetical protein